VTSTPTMASRSSPPSCACASERVVLVETRRLLKGADDRDPSKLQPFSRGTGSSNPSPSGRESGEIVGSATLAGRGHRHTKRRALPPRNRRFESCSLQRRV